MTDTDTTPSLPELPKGLFWRVVPGEFGYQDDQVQLRQKTLISSRNLWAVETPGTHKRCATKDEVAKAAQDCWTKYTQATEARKIYGDYPPKTL